MIEIDCHLLTRAMTGREDECGDTGVLRQYDGHLFFALVDILGHGKDAFDLSVLAADFLSTNYRCELVELMKRFHAHLKGTRGAVATLCRLDLSNGEMQHVGIGNITARRYGSIQESFVSRDGIIGYSITTPKNQTAKIYPGDVLILSSDGVKEHIDIDFFPDLLNGSARTIAKDLLYHFGKENDDASCLVVRYGK